MPEAGRPSENQFPLRNRMARLGGQRRLRTPLQLLPAKLAKTWECLSMLAATALTGSPQTPTTSKSGKVLDFPIALPVTQLRESRAKSARRPAAMARRQILSVARLRSDTDAPTSSPGAHSVHASFSTRDKQSGARAGHTWRRIIWIGRWSESDFEQPRRQEYFRRNRVQSKRIPTG